ncbi:RNA polymerase sigma factor [Thermoflexibacter ruber]|uniref:RNA polymerase sigma-70 factor, ECF subfamily n=1 Tax=Thermoflexibacter ruber TaxID=1003 RepID=A0A1I2HQZ8_9BACT|nr:sigma-70 family RNA polymerase sigma factor [Thermoflexibacter ruber]SFF31267.1 RNA polymerase sigma-70 factor, ECF subfamily [Thermoflexibacter ruber]
MQAVTDIPRPAGQINKNLEASNSDIHKYLIERCLENDSKAQYQLYRQYADAMYNVCMRMVKNEDEAKDLLQEAFVEAFTKLHTFRFEASFGSWLKRIVINKCINLLQKKRLLTISLEDSKSARRISEETQDDSYTQYEVKLVQKAITQLPEGCRVVLNLYLFEGYDHAEIGEILNVTESTSKAQYSKARKKLREIIEEEKKRLKLI